MYPPRYPQHERLAQFPGTPTIYPRTTRRWMGSKVGGGGPPGEILVENEQSELKGVDVIQLEKTIERIRLWLGYETYDVNLFLIDDEEMKETNFNTRKIDEATDILSYPLHSASKPGKLIKPSQNFAHLYSLGEMLIDVPYVMRRCKEDEEYFAEYGKFEYEDDGSLFYDDRGVSAAMSYVFDPELRLHMLLVHGMLHLVGYDHIKDKDYKLMVREEEKLLRHLGLPTATNNSLCSPHGNHSTIAL